MNQWRWLVSILLGIIGVLLLGSTSFLVEWQQAHQSREGHPECMERVRYMEETSREIRGELGAQRVLLSETRESQIRLEGKVEQIKQLIEQSHRGE